MGSLGVPEMIIIFILALVLFGPKKLPEIGRTVGKAITEFRRASSELKDTFNKEMQNLERETAEIKEAANQYQYDSYNYDYSNYESNYEPEHSEADLATGCETEFAAADPSSESASAPQGAELPSVETPEHTIAYGSETQENSAEAAENPAPLSASPGQETAPATAEQKA